MSDSSGTIREFDLKNDLERVLFTGEGKGVVELNLSEDDHFLHVTWEVNGDYPQTEFVTRRWKLKSIL